MELGDFTVPIICALVVIFTIILLRTKYTFWDRNDVPQISTNWIWGNMRHLQSIALSELLHEVYKKFKNSTPMAGCYIFFRPVLVVLHLDLAKAVLIRDFDKFIDRSHSEGSSQTEDPMSAHLYNLKGEKWRQMRKKLTSQFSASKMKYMCPALLDIAEEFERTLRFDVAKAEGGIIELYDMTSRFITDVIGSCIFGIDKSSLPESEFRRIGHDLFSKKPKFSIKWELYKQTYGSPLNIFRMGRFCGMSGFFNRLVLRTIKQRERDPESKKRKDLMNLLIELKNRRNDDGTPVITEDEIAAQMFIFFFAGFETSASAMCYGLYELAKNQKIQNRVRAEIYDVLEKYGDELCYEAVLNMTYLDRVISETLRKYSPVAALSRIAKERYELVDSNLVIPAGTVVYIPIKEIHYDPEFYDDPHVFNPDRFSPEECKRRDRLAFLAYGLGPRNCIGLRFSLLLTRIAFMSLIKSYRFTVVENTPDEVKPTKMNLIQVPDTDIFVKVEAL